MSQRLNQVEKHIRSVFKEEAPDFAETLVESIKESVKLTVVKDSPSIISSKIGGFPYLEKGTLPPLNENGVPFFLLAQVNFSEMPKLEKFPEKGLLQIFLDSEDNLYGLDFEDRTSQKGFKVIFKEEVSIENAETDFSIYDNMDTSDLPIRGEAKLVGETEFKCVSMQDMKFETISISDDFMDSLYENEDYENILISNGHRMGGYPYFTQYDPRHQDSKGEFNTLLLQIDMDSLEEIGFEIMFGDSGVSNFFISEENLKKKDFSKVFYNWDCC